MRIESIGVSVPSRKVTNDDILKMLEEKSNGISPIILKSYQRMVRALFVIAGSDVRYVRDSDKDEKASTFIIQAMKIALEKANLTTGDIDLLIYCGVGKGFLEPANGYFYAQKMGMTCSCFDIVDACMSWTRALEVSYEFFRSGRYRHVMILNGEFNIQHGFPDNFKIHSLRQIEYTFPTYTIGEAATATILSPSEAEWKFAYKSVPALADLCTIPLDGYDNFVEPNKRIGKNGLYNFVSYGKELFDAARRYLVPLVKELVDDLSEPDIYFPHAASDAAYLSATKEHAVPEEKMYAKVFPNYGNIVSASIPVGMDMALREGKLKRGHDVVLCPASAGMVYSAVRFVY
ncbi:MAG TPA: 3-oxoacyl-[acyl-carrier-protein] synthase III C-terminal domain-containing protein [Spirochaetia bacterium]|nr:3-oxoacyl-[acyl-carrier-protein] synthase III C-terminal domain-containing protein [Spirochaetia bacterium]